MEQQDSVTLSNARNGKLLQADMRNKIRQKIADTFGSLFKVLSKRTAHESQRISLSNLKTLSG